jgi:hypothetical protein
MEKSGIASLGAALTATTAERPSRSQRPNRKGPHIRDDISSDDYFANVSDTHFFEAERGLHPPDCGNDNEDYGDDLSDSGFFEAEKTIRVAPVKQPIPTPSRTLRPELSQANRPSASAEHVNAFSKSNTSDINHAQAKKTTSRFDTVALQLPIVGLSRRMTPSGLAGHAVAITSEPRNGTLPPHPPPRHAPNGRQCEITSSDESVCFLLINNHILQFDQYSESCFADEFIDIYHAITSKTISFNTIQSIERGVLMIPYGDVALPYITHSAIKELSRGTALESAFNTLLCFTTK